jgi:dihydroorotase
MGASTGEMLVDNHDALDAIFKESPVTIVTHCEDTPIIHENEKKFAKKYGDNLDATFHPLIRSREACLKSSTLAHNLATKHGSSLHILHLTTQDELSLFKSGDLSEKNITA